MSDAANSQGQSEGAFYNAAEDLIGRNLRAGRGDKVAFIDATGSHTYGDLEAASNRFANLLRRLGVQPEQRLVMAVLDTVDFPVCFLGAMKAGVIPVPLNTRLTADDYAFILADSRAVAAVVSEPLLPTVLPDGGDHPFLRNVLVAGTEGHGYPLLTDALAAEAQETEIFPTTRDDICFWLYTSGTTGRPKGAVHLHGHLIGTAETYGDQVLGIREDDIVYSAAKLFFAYGLGNALTFPMAVGATVVLHPGPPEPQAIVDILASRKPTIFFGVPTLYAMLLASGMLPGPGESALRLCVSAGEPLPVEILRRWREQTEVDIIDGIGTTEMLHIFLSNRVGEVVPGSTGKPVPGYTLRVVDDEGAACPPGEMGALEVSGPTAAVMYWNRREKSLETFRGAWTRTGDKYRVDENGVFHYCGRNDDMLKVGGIYVSPFEVEGALMRHKAVLEAAVVGQPDQDELIKPKAFVVLNADIQPSDELAESLKAFVKDDLASYKYPRWIEFVDDLPKTATGKIQRFKLRG